MASTIPCLRPFLASFFTGFGAMGHETVIAGSFTECCAQREAAIPRRAAA
jgi:hypothetical protein